MFKIGLDSINKYSWGFLGRYKTCCPENFLVRIQWTLTDLYRRQKYTKEIKRGPRILKSEGQSWAAGRWADLVAMAVAAQMPCQPLPILTLSSVYNGALRSGWGAILAINELITLGNGFLSLEFLCRFHLHFPRPVFISISLRCLIVKSPPWYCFWLGLFGLALAAQSQVSFRQLNKVFYFIQGGCIMPISGAIWWELGQKKKNVPWKWHPMRKDHRISFSLTLLYSFNRV